MPLHFYEYEKMCSANSFLGTFITSKSVYGNAMTVHYIASGVHFWLHLTSNFHTFQCTFCCSLATIHFGVEQISQYSEHHVKVPFFSYLVLVVPSLGHIPIQSYSVSILDHHCIYASVIKPQEVSQVIYKHNY